MELAEKKHNTGYKICWESKSKKANHKEMASALPLLFYFMVRCTVVPKT
jgi:hypothetical protein